uniref:Uncharacterized protein n=1 Tax=Lotus japonicus TaxID=34305 RepID=I3T6X8_LOTJA|nr:unknown [Lotus japonicus]
MEIKAAVMLISHVVLKATLLRHGFTFESETDKEVIPKLAKFVYDKANAGCRRDRYRSEVSQRFSGSDDARVNLVEVLLLLVPFLICCWVNQIFWSN